MSRTIAHGGRLDAAVARFGGTPSRWLDLSTGINPSPWPVPDLANHLWHRLPDAGLDAAARSAVRVAYAVPDRAGVSLAPGSQMHIQLLPLLFTPQPVAIVGFTYGEHALAWSRAGHQTVVSDGLDSAEASARIIVVVNPNNPDGTIHDPERLKALSRRLAAKGGLLVVDEAFADVTPLASIARHTGPDGLLVLRSLGKFHGLAGVRFGAALAAPSLAARLDDLLGPWAVSGPALSIAAQALGDRGWGRRASKRLSAGRSRLEEMLQQAGLDVIGGTDLFVLARHEDAAVLEQQLLTAKILPRSFPEHPTWLRFGLPGDVRALERLRKALTPA